MTPLYLSMDGGGNSHRTGSSRTHCLSAAANRTIRALILGILLIGGPITSVIAEPLPVPPSIGSADTEFDASAGVATTVQIGFPVSGSEPMSYLWLLNGIPLQNADLLYMSGPVVTIAVPMPYHAGQYQLVAANAAGSATSQVATLRVHLIPPPVVDPLGGTFDDQVRVGYWAHPITEGDAYYTTDGSDPLWGYVDPLPPQLQIAKTTTLKVAYFFKGHRVSTIFTGNYDISVGERPTAPPDAQLLAHWRFDAISGRRAREETGWHPATLSPSGAVLVPDGIAGGALSLNRQELGHAELGDFSSLTGTAYSICLWIRLPAGDDSGEAPLISKHVPGPPGGHYLSLSSFRREITAYSGDGMLLKGHASLSDGAWHHVALTRDVAGDVRLHVDGAGLNARAITGPVLESSARTLIGAWDSAAPQSTFHGAIDDLQIYNFALDSGSIAFLVAHPGQTLGIPSRAPPRVPVITAQPEGANRPLGGSLVLRVEASSDAPIDYQWYHRGVPIPGETQSTLRRPVLTAEDGGVYQVMAATGSGSVASRRVTVNVQSADSPTLVPESDLRSQTVESGGNALLQVQPSGSGPFTYQWYRDDTPVPNATSSILEIVSGTAADAGDYYVRVSNPYDVCWSQVATLAFFPPRPPLIQSQPGDSEGLVGEAVTFPVRYSGSPPVVFTWYKDDQPLEPGPQGELHLPSISPTDSGLYRVRLSNAHGEVFSAPWQFKVLLGPKLELIPPGGTFSSPTSVRIQSSHPDIPIHYSFDGLKPTEAHPKYSGPILIERSSTLTAVAIRDGQRLGDAVSGAYEIQVQAPPVIYSHPLSRTVAVGSAVKFSVVVGGSAPFRFDWYQDGTLIATLSSPSLTIDSVTPASAGRYWVVISNSGGQVTSRTATLTVIPSTADLVPVVRLEPVRLDIFEGATAVFRAVVTGEPPFNYQWHHNGARLPDAESSSLSLEKVSRSLTGTYEVTVRNVYGQATASGYLQVNRDPTPTRLVRFLDHPASRTVLEGDFVVLSAHVTGDSPITFQWWRDDVPIPGATSGVLYFPSMTTLQAGRYRLRAENIYGSAESAEAVVTVIPYVPLRFETPLQGQRIAPLTPVTLTAAVVGSGPLNYTWFFNGKEPIGIQPQLDLGPVRLEQFGNYEVVVSNSRETIRSSPVTLQPILPQLGTVLFVNRLGGVLDAPVYDLDDRTPLAGPGYLAQLYAGFSRDKLFPVGPPAPFRTGDGAGYWDPGSQLKREIEAVEPGQPAWVQVRAWDADGGDSYEEAVENQVRVGLSGTFSVTTGNGGTPPALPAPLLSLRRFALRTAPPPQIHVHPVGQDLQLGEPMTLAGVASGTGLSYQWLRNGEPLPGANQAQLSIDATLPHHAGTYQLLVSDAQGQVTSDPAVVRVITERTFVVRPSGPAMEGGRLIVNLDLASAGDVASGVLGLRFDSRWLTDPVPVWSVNSAAANLGFKQTDTNRLQFLFSDPNRPIPAGTSSLAQVSFRVRTVASPTTVPLTLDRPDVADASGRPILFGTAVEPGDAVILKRRVAGDHNANDRVDIADATRVARLVSRQDTPQPWDLADNDLTLDGQLDSLDLREILQRVIAFNASEVVPEGAVSSLDEPPLLHLSVHPPIVPIRGRIRVTAELRPLARPPAGITFRLRYPSSMLRWVETRVAATDAPWSMGADAVAPPPGSGSEVDTLRFAAAGSRPWAPAGGPMVEWNFEVSSAVSPESAGAFQLDQIEFTWTGDEIQSSAGVEGTFTTRERREPRLWIQRTAMPGLLQLGITGEPAVRYRLEASDNLISWNLQSTVVLDAEGTARHSDATLEDYFYRFYRVREDLESVAE